ncbi:MAG TPA: sigma-70 family RNA polymerase sigma factor [Pirellulales bacterium]|jgi:RNA polymerase sigma-70 factor (ECF subfamily)|nr:sigma-70 family RNA polymerase sigma factor [Pirellulales bacterium]
MDKSSQSEAGSDDASALVGQVLAGDQAAACELIERLYPLAAKIVSAYVPRDLGSVSQDDLLQEVFLRVFSRLDQYRGDSPLGHWVSRVAVRVCIDAIRSKGKTKKELRWSDLDPRQAALLGESTGAAATADPVDTVAARELSQKLLETLSAEDRVILTMLDLEGYRVAEVAERVGRTRVSVKVRALRARRKLHGVLERLLGERPAQAPAASLETEPR